MTAPTTTIPQRCACGHADYEHARSRSSEMRGWCALCACQRFTATARPRWLARLKAKDLTGSVAL